MTVVGNFNFSFFLQLTWEFLGFESECGGSDYWPNNEIIDRLGLDIAPTPTNKEDPANRIGSVQTIVHTYGAHEFE